jgi:hypothetical protein
MYLKVRGEGGGGSTDAGVSGRDALMKSTVKPRVSLQGLRFEDDVLKWLCVLILIFESSSIEF